jgi:hypothetical protein
MPPSEPSRAEALFTGMRGSRILGSLLAGSCIDRPPGGVRMASKALHAVRRRSYNLWCWMDMQGDESNPAPPRPDPLRVGEGSLLR